MTTARSALTTTVFHAFPVLDLFLRVATTVGALALGFVMLVAAVTLGDRTGSPCLAMALMATTLVCVFGMVPLAYVAADWALKRIDHALPRTA
ncbi:hypothetical protein WK35_25425 [Burkholderia vietnamiensis]|uniref:hypothetical protein n=1 Tax=Burkholderia vietnamiensis TaxID=60552 RepID=UPI00076197C5|nr:hypothetical protein [Burkholderia vietnamiensis]KVS42092.1 hypothetical protein WK35_25425 [Burkholderia vietnamiensis]